MNRKYKTEQESFWAGEFGAEYIKRNASDKLIASNIALFSKALAHAHSLNSCVEFGANIGLNLRALKALYPNQEQYAIEINQTAADELATVIPTENVYRTSILDFSPPVLGTLPSSRGYSFTLARTTSPRCTTPCIRQLGAMCA